MSEEKYRMLFNSIDQGFCICEMLVDENGVPYDYRFLEVNARFEDHTGLKDATGKTALEMLPGLEPHWIEIYGKVALTGERLHFVQGSEVMGRWFEVYAFRIGDPQTYQFAVLFTEISERKHAETRSQLLQSLAAALSAALTQNDVIDIFINQGVAQLGADTGTLMVLSEDHTHLELVGALGYSHEVIEKWRRIPLNYPTAPITIAIRDQRPLWLGSPEERAALVPSTPNLSPEEQHQAWAVLPFRLGDDLIGAIGLGYNRPRTFDEAERTLFLTLTDYCAQALDRARLTEKMRTLAAVEERQRLARDLHDAVSQILFASTSLAESLPQTWDRDLQQGRESLRHIVNLNRGALAEMRKLLLELRPEAIVRTPFVTLLRHLTSALQAQKEIQVEMEAGTDEDCFLAEEAHIALYRITQEALNNVIKHSAASQLKIDFLYREPYIRLMIEDNGRGFDPHQVSMGIGMNSMRERAAAIGASLVIESEPGKGTRLTIEWEAPDEEKA